MTSLAHSAQTAVLTRPNAPVLTPTAPLLKAPRLGRSRIGAPVTRLLRPVKPSDRGWNPGLAMEEAAPFGFRIAQPAELVPAHAASEAIMNMPEMAEWIDSAKAEPEEIEELEVEY